MSKQVDHGAELLGSLDSCGGRSEPRRLAEALIAERDAAVARAEKAEKAAATLEEELLSQRTARARIWDAALADDPPKVDDSGKVKP
jgi:hypothetical protein